MPTAPQITINGKKYTMLKPKIKLWRHMIKFTEVQQRGELTNEEILDEMINLIVIAFDSPEVTAASIEESIDFDDLVNLFKYIGQHVAIISNTKMAQIPNAGAPART